MKKGTKIPKHLIVVDTRIPPPQSQEQRRYKDFKKLVNKSTEESENEGS